MIQEQPFLLSRENAYRVLPNRNSETKMLEADLAELPQDTLRPYRQLVQMESGFRALHDELLGLAALCPTPKYVRQPCPEFEAEAAVIVHKALRVLPEELLIDKEFWLWLTIYVCRDIVRWRHTSGGSLDNYGVGDMTEGLLCRLFMRAQLVYDASDADPYRLAQRGTQDFWRSFMIRRNYASVKPMARAIAHFVNFSAEVPLSDEQVRILGPKITQLNGTYTYEVLNETSCSDFVLVEAKRLAIND
jgi:hypothetical protein